MVWLCAMKAGLQRQTVGQTVMSLLWLGLLAGSLLPLLLICKVEIKSPGLCLEEAGAGPCALGKKVLTLLHCC